MKIIYKILNPNQEWLDCHDNQQGFQKGYIGDGSFEKSLES